MMPFSTLKKEIVCFFKKHQIVLYAIFIIAILGYGFEITNFSLTIDEEMELARAFQEPFSNVQIWHIGNLRFVLGWLRSVFSINGSFVPYVTTLFGVFWLGASAFLWCVLLKKYFPKANSLAFIGFVAMYMTVPFVIPELLIFAITCDITFFGNFLITLALFFIIFTSNKNKKWYYIYAALCAFLSFNIYQAFAGVFVIGFAAILLVWLLSQNEQSEITIKNILKFSKNYIVIGAIGVGGYVAFTKILALVYQLKKTDYVNSMFRWGADGLSTSLYNVAATIYRTISPKGSYGSKIVLATLFFLIVFTLVYLLKNRNRKGVAVAIVAAFFTLSTYSLPILLGLNTPFRMLQTLLPFMGITWFLLLYFSKGRKNLYIILTIVGIGFFSHQILLLNSFFYSSHVVSQTDQWNTKMIAHDILRKNEGKYPEVPVIFVGKHEENIPQGVKVDTIGGSMIHWQGTNARIYDLMYLQGFHFYGDYTKYADDFTLVTAAQELAKDMPIWPAESSILVTDEMVVVRLNEKNNIE